DEQDHVDPGPAAGAQHQGCDPEHGKIRHHVKAKHDLATARQLVDGLEARRCRKAQGSRRQAPRSRGIEAVAHAISVRIVVCADPMTGGGGKMMTLRSTGKVRVARSLWYARKGVAELRTARLAPPAPGEA